MKKPDEIKPSKQERVDKTISSKENNSINPVSHFYEPSQVGVFKYTISYVMLDKDGTVLMAGRGNHLDNSPLFLPQGKSNKPAPNASFNSNTTNKSITQDMSVSNSNDEQQPYTHIYTSYNGVLEQEGVCKDIQVIFMAQPTGAPIQNADHTALNLSLKSIINKHRVAMEPGIPSKTYQKERTNTDGTLQKSEWTVTPDKCLFGINKITLNLSDGQHYFCGECKPSKLCGLTIEDMKNMIGHTLEGIIFNTKGTVTRRFKDVKITDMVDKDKDKKSLDSNIPEKCMEFTMKPPDKEGDFDDNLKKTISTPERRRKCDEKQYDSVKRQRIGEDDKYVQIEEDKGEKLEDDKVGKRVKSSIFKPVRVYKMKSIEIDPAGLDAPYPILNELK